MDNIMDKNLDKYTHFFETAKKNHSHADSLLNRFSASRVLGI